MIFKEVLFYLIA